MCCGSRGVGNEPCSRTGEHWTVFIKFYQRWPDIHDKKLVYNKYPQDLLTREQNISVYNCMELF